jgi:glutamate dehydrogenase/leucine dehydrogenase
MFYFFPMSRGKKTRAPKPADAPLVLTKANGESWDQEADVVVVGFGGAGACAALEAKAQGARVLVLDRFHGGGATAISGGVFYAGGGTHIQREAGVDDDRIDARVRCRMPRQCRGTHEDPVETSCGFIGGACGPAEER